MTKFINKILYEHLQHNRFFEFESEMSKQDETDDELSLLQMRYYKQREMYRDMIRLYQRLKITRYQHFYILIDSVSERDCILTFDLFIRYHKLYEPSKIIGLIEILILRSPFFINLLDTVLNKRVYFKQNLPFTTTENVNDVYPSLTECEKKFDTYPDYSNLDGMKDCVIVDCANIIYKCGGSTKNGFKYLENILSSIPNKKILILHKKYKKLFKTYLPNVPNTVLYETPYGTNDDNYIILLSIFTKSVIVSNDQFRDHIANMNSDIFTEWVYNNLKTHEDTLYTRKKSNVVRFDGLHYYVPINLPPQSRESLFYKI